LKYIKELHLNPRNDFILLDSVNIEEIQNVLDKYELNFKCYTVSIEEALNYFLMMYKSTDNYEIIDNYNTELSQRHLVINENTTPEQKYLEIGIEYGYNFDNVHFKTKIGVDPDPKCENEIIKLTSDDFFEKNCDFFDTVFIDGMHQSEYVLRDFNNSISKLNDNGVIFIDDILPLNYNEQLKIPNKHVYENGILKYREPWTGDVWKVVYYMLKYHSTDFEFKFYNNQNYRGVGVFKILNKFNIPEASIDEINAYEYYKDFNQYLIYF
jgi:hypothetical protein